MIFALFFAELMVRGATQPTPSERFQPNPLLPGDHYDPYVEPGAMGAGREMFLIGLTGLLLTIGITWREKLLVREMFPTFMRL